MTNNSMTKAEYSKVEKGNGSDRTSGSHTRGSEIDTTQYLGSKSDTHCLH